ncbi:bifunctional molybdopterin-guanine dinucleotide biosynthesis protein MobA/MobB family protein [[Clostridium] asparagiforme DSM 15981]|nr:bifunctional molybdopterin-guanine dinucleotide biosynthesis protein MobA/MobB family protein [[Clostridium] asparagiforme DSM 15981]
MELKCGAVILAGGRGSRFGGVNKAELSYLGKSFCGRIREEFDRLGMDCFFSAGAYPPPEESGLKVIPDLPVEGEEGPIGPMGGILSCFEQTQCDLLFFVSCDMPLFHRRMAARLLELWTPGTDALVWRTRSGRLQPLCGLYARSCLPALRECAEQRDYRLMHFLGKISCAQVETSAEQIPDFWFCNVNSKETYGALSGFRPPVLAVSGTKNTGKTTLLERLVVSLTSRGLRVAVVKHDGHDFEADVPGTDSRRMQEAGA